MWVDPEARRAPAVLGVVIQDSSRPASSPRAFVLAEQSRSHMTLALALYRSADLAAAGDVQLLDVLDLNGDGVGELLLRLPKNGAWRYLVFKRLGGEWVKLYEGGGGGC